MARSCNPFFEADIRGGAALGRCSVGATALLRSNWGWRPPIEAVPALESYGCGTLVFWSAHLPLLAFSAFAMGRLMGFGGWGGVSWGPRGLGWLPGSPNMGSLNSVSSVPTEAPDGPGRTDISLSGRLTGRATRQDASLLASILQAASNSRLPA